jgi:D-alanine-D-alanine ligase
MTIIILFGGRSDERHVSVASAQNIVRTLDEPRNPPLVWFWTPNGAIVDVNRDELLAHPRPFTDDFQPSRPAIWPDLEMALDTLPVDDPVFFLALHGGEGEDGTVQRMMEKRGIPFLELNTLPGLTASSLLPQELREAGIEFRDFLERQMALGRLKANRPQRH